MAVQIVCTNSVRSVKTFYNAQKRKSESLNNIRYRTTAEIKNVLKKDNEDWYVPYNNYNYG